MEFPVCCSVCALCLFAVMSLHTPEKRLAPLSSFLHIRSSGSWREVLHSFFLWAMKTVIAGMVCCHCVVFSQVTSTVEMPKILSPTLGSKAEILVLSWSNYWMEERKLIYINVWHSFRHCCVSFVTLGCFILSVLCYSFLLGYFEGKVNNWRRKTPAFKGRKIQKPKVNLL